MAESVFFTLCLFDFILLLEWTKVHIVVKILKVNETEAAESIITLYTTHGVLLVGSNWDDATLECDLPDNVTQSHLFSNASGGQTSCVERAFSQTHHIGEALAINDLSLTLSSEHSLNLLEDACELHLRLLEQAELPGGGLAPVDSSVLRETFESGSGLADSDVVVSFNS